jgi:Bacterial Ig domain
MTRFSRRFAFRAILGLWVFGGSAATAQTCHVDGPRYSLQEDIVSWSMKIVSGRSCIRGIRFSNVQIGSLKLISPPRIGQVEVQGSGFVYSPKADFHGHDAFSLVVVGFVNGRPGRSTIQVIVSDDSSQVEVGNDTIKVTVSENSSRETTADTTPPSVEYTAPSEGATISGPNVVLRATASDNVAVANVRFFVKGEKIGKAAEEIGSALVSPPYQTSWDSTRVADGSYKFYVVARDTSGNSESSWVRVMVKNK